MTEPKYVKNFNDLERGEIFCYPRPGNKSGWHDILCMMSEYPDPTKGKFGTTKYCFFLEVGKTQAYAGFPIEWFSEKNPKVRVVPYMTELIKRVGQYDGEV